MPTPLVDVDDVAAQLHKVKASDLGALSDLVDTASALLTDMCIPLQPATITDQLDGGQPSVLLSTCPVNSITSVTTFTAGGGSTVIPEAGGTTGLTDGWRLDPIAGALHRVGYRAWPLGWGNVQVVYTVGPAAVPPNVEQAAIILTEHLWQFRKVTGGPNQPNLPGNDTMGYSPSYAVPNQVIELVRNYLKPPRVG